LTDVKAQAFGNDSVATNE